MTASLNGGRVVLGAKITHSEYAVLQVPVGNSYERFLYKRKTFEHEKEVRLFFNSGTPDPALIDRTKSYGDEVPEDEVLRTTVDLRSLVSLVYVAPE